MSDNAPRSATHNVLMLASLALALLALGIAGTDTHTSVDAAMISPPARVPAAVASPPDDRARNWQPPLGIPAPTFGILDTAPADPSPWNGPVAGFYYVESSAPNATDANNPNGSPRAPRASIPTRLPAGSVVEVRGIYDRDHSDSNAIMATGTAAQPVFIRGLSEAQKTDVVRAWQISGSYVVIEFVRFRALDGTTTGSLTFLSPLDHAAVRHSEITGNLNAGGMGIESWYGGTIANDVVVWNNLVHDNGNVAANFDQDRHGIHVGDHVNHVWVVDNQMWRNSGDGIQISARTAANQPTTHHIYVGRNISHDNKQNGFWTKQAVDVIFSQNVTYNNRPGNSSMGVGLGFQYAPDYVWFLFNHVFDSDYGIGTGSDSDLGTGTESFYVGNLIHDIHISTGDFKTASAWQTCGISLPGGINRYVVNNTIYNADSGVCMPSPYGKAEIHNNLIFNVRPDGQHIFLEFPQSAIASVATGNMFGPNYRALTAGVQHTYNDQAIGQRGQNAVVRDPRLAMGTAQPYDLLPDSPAIDFGVDDPAGVYTTYLRRYGIDIRRDILGRIRPAGRGYDAGAFESPFLGSDRR